MERAGIPYVTPEEFTQSTLYASGWDYINDRYLASAMVVLPPDEIEESTDSNVLSQWRPPPRIVYRLKEEVAKSNGLTCKWNTAVRDEPEDVTLPDGNVLSFPKGCITIARGFSCSKGRMLKISILFRIS